MGFFSIPVWVFLRYLARRIERTRVEVWRWIFVRNAVKENNFQRVFFTPFGVNAVNSYKKTASLHGFEPLTSCMPSTAYCTAPTVTYFIDCSCEFKEDWVNVGNELGEFFLRNAVNFAVNFWKKCGEMRWNIYCHRYYRNHRISYQNSPHSPHFLQIFIRKPRPGKLSVFTTKW